ncbi:MAG: hypothetical protein CMI13_03035 [Oleibacter sp.]|nr:hypothetical protein [Thalassolituus sp.]|tara:strand:+ start:320 stop:604 length:285 start_codon:yes stop_codon:yes gene_type:complete
MTKVLCDIYKSRKKDEAYLYVSRKDGLTKVPEELYEIFGKPELAMTIIITPDKKLARTDGSKVLEGIDEKGFYLQMPPAKETYMLDLFCKLDKE